MPEQPLLPYWYSYSGNVTASSHSPAAPGPPGHCVDDKQTGSESQQTVTENWKDIADPEADPAKVALPPPSGNELICMNYAKEVLTGTAA